MIRELFSKSILILGCGNVLIGDDGFGPAVIERLHRRHDLPEDAVAVDVGTSVRDLLFNLLLSPSRPKRIFIVDAVSTGRQAGSCSSLTSVSYRPRKSMTFHFTSSLREFARGAEEQCGADVRVLVVQAGRIPTRCSRHLPGGRSSGSKGLQMAFRAS
jgi:coenzyme F420 hydrogenase subunit delta